MENLHWLVVHVDKPGKSWPLDEAGFEIHLKLSPTLQEATDGFSYRCSPIFPVNSAFDEPNFNNSNIYFYCFESAFAVLGRLCDIGSSDLVANLWYSIGLASIILITNNPLLNDELLSKAPHPPRSRETWEIVADHVTKINYCLSPSGAYDPDSFRVPPYSSLPPAERSVIDEFVANIAFIVPKVAAHLPSELDKFPRLVGQISKLISELTWVRKPEGPKPVTLAAHSEDSLRKDTFLRGGIANQALDRIIQVNSALSYVCSQMLSGAIPILERRSLIRRHSLLGIGTATLALGRISHTIENAFSTYSIEKLIVDRFEDTPPLPGLKKVLNYDHSKWSEYSVNRWHGKEIPRTSYPKLPYFSGRLGFRETEYSISAAIQSLSAGISLEWSLLTLTHELLHGHVRNIIVELFRGDPTKPSKEKYHEFYNKFRAYILLQEMPKNELESLRIAILAYCCITATHGSITQHPDPRAPKFTVRVPDIEQELWNLLEVEDHNINEIFVHILDLHYFYASRLSAYVPLIWRSWASVPHVAGDLRQYVLRTLLAISSKVEGSPYARFLESVQIFNELLEDHVDAVLNTPTIHSLISFLHNEELLESLVYPFTASLILVDIATDIFKSYAIRAKLMADQFATLVSDTKVKVSEDKFEYSLPEGFVEAPITSVPAYLLSKVLRQLEEPIDLDTEGRDVVRKNGRAFPCLLFT